MKRYKHRVINGNDFFVVGAIDLMSFGRLHCWNGERLESELGRAGTTCLVALRPNCGVGSGAIAGFIIYRTHIKADKPAWLEVVRIAVDDEYRRLGAGRSLVNKVAGHLRPSRPELVVEVPDQFLPDAHLFFKACGFIPQEYLHGQRGEQDSVRMVRFLSVEAAV